MIGKEYECNCTCTQQDEKRERNQLLSTGVNNWRCFFVEMCYKIEDENALKATKNIVKTC